MQTNEFTMFSAAHLSVIIIFFILVGYLYVNRHRLRDRVSNLRGAERSFAFILLAFEIGFHLWMVGTGRWRLQDSLPLELCSISLLATIILLWTGKRSIANFVIFAGIAGALQAMITPVLDMNFPHFRFFHFFVTHAGIILTGLYFVWVRGYTPTLRGVFQAFLLLNILLPLILFINKSVEGNYMFLARKPLNGSLLDYLGPYPWYIASLEVVALGMFLIIWLLLREKGKRQLSD
ncbi:TIGR02206 family membrane protein [Sporosarcina cyprini]|uniref:YwaF family protein n=1 Tax=Sporosarcina cyprini TaxID=2910523 RepID=UPI001EDF2BAE|nr:TIGR02206 family membrane protein [Sporosarcina cyprini]MCG3088785.1 TIGR02206 family membrane protein [Sporosarcina cyprini]